MLFCHAWLSRCPVSIGPRYVFCPFVGFHWLVGVLEVPSSFSLILGFHICSFAWCRGGSDLLLYRLAFGVLGSWHAVLRIQIHTDARAHSVSSVHARARPAAKFKKAKYLPSYTARAILLASMHRAGVGRLGGTGQISVGEFAAAFPDERQWFTRLCSSSDTTTVKKFFSDLGYKGRPEFCSMFSCLLLTRSMWLSDAWLSHHCASLRKAMRSQRHHRIMRLPALCVRDVLSKDTP